MNTSIKLKNVSAFYDGKAALKDVSLDIEKNKITAVIGPSGCGKSTMLKCMNRLLDEEPGATVTGEIFLDETNIQRLPANELRRRMGLVFQTPLPFPFSIYKNMVYAPKYYGIKDYQKLNVIVEEKLKMAGLYEEVKDDLNKNALKLSGGQQQRLCIARALTAEPEILLLDEPCSALDIRSSAIIEETLIKLKDKYTIIVVTHNIAQAQRISDNVVFLLNGQVVEAGSADKIFNEPDKKETKAFLTGIYG